MKNSHISEWYIHGTSEGAGTRLEKFIRDKLIRAGRPVTQSALRSFMWRYLAWRGHLDEPPPRAIMSEAELDRLLGLPPPDTVLPPPGFDVEPVITRGRWKSHFLTADYFFGPAIAARPEPEWHSYFKFLLAGGHTHCLMNSEQHDWGPSKGHPEWTKGGIRSHDSTEDRDRFVRCVLTARTYNLIPVIGLMDQPSLVRRSWDEIFRKTEALLSHKTSTGLPLSDYTDMVWASWEIREVMTDSAKREEFEDEWIAVVRPFGLDFGIHYQATQKEWREKDDGRGGGIDRYGVLEAIYPGQVVRLLQLHNESDLDTSRRQLDATAGVVHRDHGLGKFCLSEFRSELNQPKTWTRHEVDTRRDALMDHMAGWLADDRIGYLN